MSLVRRVAAAQATLDRFQGKPFKLGRYDCGQMVAYHLRRMGRPIKASKAGPYHNVVGAKRALRRLGHESLPSVIDAHFTRIAPAAALVGDLIQLTSEDDTIGGIFVVLGNGRVLGYHQDVPGAEVLQPSEYVAAWRVEPPKEARVAAPPPLTAGAQP